MAIEVFSLKQTIATANVLTLNGTPVTLIEAPGSGRAILLLSAAVFLDYNSIAYATNTNLQIQTDGSNEVLFESGILQSVNDTFVQLTRVSGAAGNDQVIENAAVEATVETGNPTAGNSPITIYLTYVKITT